MARNQASHIKANQGGAGTYEYRRRRGVNRDRECLELSHDSSIAMPGRTCATTLHRVLLDEVFQIYTRG